MTDSSVPSQQQRALMALRAMRARVEELERAQRAPIAVIGVGCRLPGGASNLDRYWELLASGRDAVHEIRPERLEQWKRIDPSITDPGRVASFRGGFLQEAVDQFDPDFFNISPREAASMDPQQRLLLEVSWEAFEHARIPPSSLLGSRTGVFVGLMTDDFTEMELRTSDPDRMGAYTFTGSAPSVAAGRLAFTYGFHGPTATVDTACSSSLVAIHLACQSLRAGESDYALACGVSLDISPNVTIAMTRVGALSPDGRCFTFDARANGYVRGEGCGVVVLARLSDALKSGHPIIGVILGSAINHDGRSSGLTAPNGSAQEALLRQALGAAQLAPADVSYLEAHGTGTGLGDPIEVLASVSVLGEDRGEDNPLFIASAKTNLGHLEAAAGIAGLIKVLLALEHRQLPPHLNFERINPGIAVGNFPLEIPHTLTEWSPPGRRIGGVSSFGISGTNAHVILEEAPPVEASSDNAPVRAAELIVVSAKTPTALDAVAARLREHVDGHPELGLGDLAYSLATTRTHHEHRLALAVSSREALTEALAAVAQGETPASAVRGELRSDRGKLAWLFSGQGGQLLGMGRGLYDEWPAFRAALDEAFAALDRHLDHPVRDFMWGTDSSRLDWVQEVAPALFALQWALAALFRSWGIEPDVVAGHSIGELAAACVAGVFSLEDGARLVAARGRLMQALPAGGAMVAIGASESEVGPALAPYSESASIAVINSVDSVVISGDEAIVFRVAEQFAAKGVRTKRLSVSHASHSPRMVPMLEAFRRVAQNIRYHEPKLPVVSNVTGALAGAELATSEYWVRHVREAVRFADGVQALHAEGVTTFLELGPKALLLGLIPRCLEGVENLTLLASLRPDRPEPEAVLSALGGAFAQGCSVDWTQVFPEGGHQVALPTYPWQRRRFWVEPPSHAAREGIATGHPLLGVRIPAVGADAVFETVLSPSAPPWLSDHQVAGQVVVPGAALVEMLRAAAENYLELPAQVSGLVIQVPLLLSEEGASRIQVVVEEGGTQASIYSQPAHAQARAPWTLHATAQLGAAQAPSSPLEIAGLRARCSDAVDVAATYAGFDLAGLGYGPSFQGIRRLSRSAGEVFAEVAYADGADASAFGVHPALLDAAIQTSLILAAGDESDGTGPWLPFEMGRFVVHQLGRASAIVHARLDATVSSARVVDISLVDERTGALVAEVLGLRLRRADPSALQQRSAEPTRDALFRVEWQNLDLAATAAATGRWVVVTNGDDAAASALETALRAGGATCERVSLEGLARALPADHVAVCLGYDSATAPEVAIRGAIDGLTIVKALSGEKAAPRVWWFTQGAVSVAADGAVAPAAATVWGLGRTVMHEHPELHCTLVDLESPETAGLAVLQELAGTDVESQVAWRGGKRYVARLAKAPNEASTASKLRTDGTVLITGGLGALGREVARWLAKQQVKHLVLTGRRGLETPGAKEAALELEGLGARVTLAAVDVADEAALARVLSEIPKELPLRGVVHTAGVLDDGVLSEQTAERFERVMAPKVKGAWNLHTLTKGAALDFFVLFSSVMGTFGSAGQAPYTAANAYLDALAAHRRTLGLPAVSLAWGPFGDGGMAASLAANLKARLVRQGIGMLSAEQGLALFEQALHRSESHLALVPLHLRVVGKAFGTSVPPLWRGLVRAPVARAADGTKGAWARELSGLAEEQRRQSVIDTVRGEVARVLSLGGPHAVPVDRPVQELGLDSLMAVELRNALGRRAGARLPATLAFDYPTPTAIAHYLLSEVLRLTEVAAPVVQAAAPAVASEDPIVIVGMGCRYPGGVSDPESFWRLLDEGVDAIAEVPKERWNVDELYDPNPDAPGKMTTRNGGFLRDVDRFDPAFFGIAPREAQKLDPQQRLLLETTWEALERAGIPPERLAGTSAGVFVGAMYNEYGTLGGDLESLDGYGLTGSLGSVASGRISYLLGVQGPSMTVDTACSSSLVAVHLACQALRNGECSVALAGGVAFMQTPTVFVEFSRLRGLAADGRCKSFSAAADGAAWAEGCGMLVLERLSDARGNGHPVLAIIRGSAVNQDGRSNGLTAPNGPAQQAVIREALRRAGVTPERVDYVECHGTGTPLGDPIEVQAAAAVLGEGHTPEQPLVLGSVKTNFGHAQSAAGAAGIMKVVLSLQHGRIPKNLHFDEPSPHIPWSELPVKVATEALEWPRSGKPRIAGVSSFGISGTNAHVVLEEAPVEAAQEGALVRAAELVVLSGKTAAALEAAAGRLGEHLDAHADASLGDLAYSLATTRAHHPHRVALAVSSREALREALAAVARAETPASSVRGEVGSARGKLAWLFTGQGAQTLGMGRELYEAWPTFRNALDAAFAALDPHLPNPVREVMWGTESAELDETGWTQPALFAVEWALAELWRSWGVTPEVVAGHSIGELTAACVAGVFSLEDAARLVAARGRLMQALPAGGAMVAIGASESDVAVAVEPYAEKVSIAAVNARDSVVISGDEEVVLRIAEQFAAKGVRTKRLAVSHAFHSPRMDPMLEEFGRVAASVTYQTPTLPVVSNVTGAVAGAELGTAEYWVRHVREAVRFAQGIETLYADGVRTFAELGPKATLLGLVPSCLAGANDVTLRSSLLSDRSETEAIALALGGLYIEGRSLDWTAVFPKGRRVELPTYPWQRQRYWVDPKPQASREGAATGHPLLGLRLPVVGADAVYQTVLTATAPSWLDEHRVGGKVIVPGAALAELLRAAGEDYLELSAEVRGLIFQAPLVVAEQGAQRIQVLLEEGGTKASIYSRRAQSDVRAPWTLHASAQLGPAQNASGVIEIATLRKRCTDSVDVGSTYAAFEALGLGYGPSFQGMRAVWRQQGEALAEVALPEGIEVDGYGVHPALLDAALQTGIVAAGSDAGDGGPWLPFEIGRLVIHRYGSARAVVHARSVEPTGSSDARVFDVAIADETGTLVAEVLGLRARRLDLEALRGRAADTTGDALFRVEWQKADAPATATPTGRWLLVDGDAALAASLEAGLGGSEAKIERVALEGLAAALPAEHVVVCVGGASAAEAIRAATDGLAVVKAAVGQKTAPRLWWLTRQAVAVSAKQAVEPGAATVWGLGRTLLLEHPELASTLIDLDAVESAPTAIVHELASAEVESQVAWRGGKRYVARLAKAPNEASAPTKLPTDGTVLITGGLGALGREVARWLAKEQVKHLVLTGRRGLETPGAKEAVLELEGLGARVTVAAVDAANQDELARVLSEIPKELPLRGVVHAAGVLDDGVLSEQTAERFERVMAPKVKGAWNLHALTKGGELDFFVLFSSVAGTFGSAGQGPYGAANAYLDALAAHRRALGLPAVSLAWGPWAEGGMAASLAANLQTRLARQGMGMLSAEQGIGLLEKSLHRSESQLVVVPLQLRAVAKSFGGSVPTIWRGLVRSPVARAADGTKGAWARELHALTEEQRRQAVIDAVRGEVARVLSLGGPHAVAVDRPLQERGLDSLMAVELRNGLGRRAGATLPATLAFDYPTPTAIAEYLLSEVLRLTDVAAPVAQAASVAASDDPIAIVGMGCRYPGGVSDPESFWRLLDEGVDAITEVPKERWNVDELYDPDPDAAGKMTTRSGGFLRDVDQFDPAFFGIAPREAQKLDPQQRLLLETSWEALERAGIPPELLAGTSAGVFVGAMYNDYGTLGGDLESLDGYGLTGSLGSVASGRISYILGVEGPSMTVDTACSSSLVTVHLACQALRNGECSIALAGGVALMQTPSSFVEFSRLRGLAADGRCKSFSAAADGVAWAEGCGMLVLERLSDARRNGHPVLAIIRGSAVNQDGRSNGLTAPNGPAQQAVIREALRRAGVTAESVGYLECHGTGTPLGDPIEVQAAAAALGEGHTPEQPLVLGSVKSNFGHTQSAAGAAGIMKVVLSMQHGRIPKNLHFDAPSPHIPWSELPVKVATEALDWARNGKPRIAGVSSFGISGTNAHVVIEEAPPEQKPAQPAPVRSAELVVLSGKTPTALDAAAARLRDHVDAHPDFALGDLAFSASTRAHYEHRLGLAVASREALRDALDAASRGETPAGSARGERFVGSPKIAFVFPGQGSQWLGMGRQLLEEPAFREALTECDRAIAVETGWSVLDELAAPPEASRLDRIDVVQPTLFAMEVALAALWRSWGVVPDVVVGHSMGEVAAACVAGSLPLEHAAAVICRRSRLLRQISGKGEMAVVELSFADAQELLVGYEDKLGVGVSNSPRSTVLSGEPAALAEVLAKLEARGTFCRRVKVDVASHSPQVDPLREDLLAALAAVVPQRGAVPMRSTVTGELLDGSELLASYWAENLRQPVRFADVVQTLIADGHTVFVEMSPHPLLVPAVTEIGSHVKAKIVALSSTRRNQPERLSLLESLGGLYTAGHSLDSKALFPRGGLPLDLPTYPWQRERFWVETPVSGSDRRDHSGGHPFLGIPTSLSTQSTTRVWETSLSLERLPWLGHHQVGDAVIFPGAGYLEMALAAGSEALGDGPIELVEAKFSEALPLAKDAPPRVQLVATEERPGQLKCQIASSATATAWTIHARLSVRRDDLPPPAAFVPATLSARLSKSTSAQALYEAFTAMGLNYGPTFQGVADLWRGESESLGRIVLPSGTNAAAFRLHPALLDACFHVMAGALPANETVPWVPVEVASLRLFRRPTGSLWCHARLDVQPQDKQDRRSANLTLVDDSGALVAEVRGLVVQKLVVAPPRREEDDWFLGLTWELAELPTSRASHGRWLILGQPGPFGIAVRKALEAAGHTVVHAAVDDSSASGVRALVAEAFGNEPPSGIVHLRSLDGEGAPYDFEEALARGCDSVLHTIHAIAKMNWREHPRLWLVTRGAQPLDNAPVDVAQASLLGLGRTVAMEHSELRCTRLDLDPHAADGGIDALCSELLADDREDEIAWRAGERRVARLVRAVPDQEQVERTELADGRPFRLETRKPGVLEQMALHQIERRAPGPGEVEIQVHAAGLNFLDVLLALGVMPNDVPGAVAGAVPLGGECAGRVLAVGEGVEGLKPGDEVVGIARGSIGSHVTTPAALVVRRPNVLSPVQAAGLPIAYLTAWYGLDKVARLRKGERILIHAATGGVGLAAIQWARHVGAEVFATAGTPAKRAMLAELGVRYVSDSRSDRFVTDVLEWTGGEGVDVVLNSLAGNLIEKSFNLLRPYGRFIEIGKTDYYANSQLGLRPFLRNLSFSLVDLRGMTFQRPDLVRELLEELMGHFETGAFSPQPVETFPVSRAEEAFRKMAQAQHVGKLVITLDDPAPRIRVASRAATVDPNGTYLITGGLGGLGLSVAGWLVDSGARHLILIGRSGAVTDVQKSAVANLEATGAQVTVAAVDVADRAALASVIDAIPAPSPLRGVIHAAGLLDDGLLEQQTPTRFRKVMGPKVQGAWNLHTLTSHLDLDMFVLYASAAGVFGSPGQSNYAAANTFLDGLAHHRRAHGLPAVSIDWGAFSEVGLAAENANRAERLAGRGMANMTPAQGLVALSRTLSGAQAQVSIIPFDVRQWIEFYPAAAASPLLKTLRAEASSSVRKATGDRELLAKLEALAPDAQDRLIQDFLRQQVSRVLRIPLEKVDSETPFTALGMDSLMSLELRNRIESALGIRLPTTALWTYPTIVALTARLVSRAEAAPPPAPAQVVEVIDPTPSAIETMQTDDLLSFVDDMLEGLNQETGDVDS